MRRLAVLLVAPLLWACGPSERSQCEALEGEWRDTSGYEWSYAINPANGKLEYGYHYVLSGECVK